MTAHCDLPGFELPGFQLPGERPAFLASVRTPAEALVVADCGAQIIDAKEPRVGALGALDHDTIAAIRRIVPAHLPVSATTGDLPADAVDAIADAARGVLAAGADLVKIGIFPGASPLPLLARLASDTQGRGRRVAVLVAEAGVDRSLLDRLPAAGFAGVMLDTADKGRGALTEIMDRGAILEFICAARRARLFSGLAGSLRLRHIPALAGLQPDVVGFRGALCADEGREADVEAHLVRGVRRSIDAAFGKKQEQVLAPAGGREDERR